MLAAHLHNQGIQHAIPNMQIGAGAMLKWAQMLHNPYILGGPQQGDKIRIGCLTPAFSGAHQWAEMLHNPAFSGVPNKGDKIKAQKKQKNKDIFPLCP